MKYRDTYRIVISGIVPPLVTTVLLAAASAAVFAERESAGLQTLTKLAEWPQHCERMRNFIGMMEQLTTLCAQ